LTIGEKGIFSSLSGGRRKKLINGCTWTKEFARAAYQKAARARK
jgi:hypothetical protein